MEFKKATKADSRLRLAIHGPAGSGKTYSSLAIAKGMGLQVALIDTEHGSASKYADVFDFDVAEMEQDKSIDAVIQYMAGATDYGVLIIDSLTHSWHDLLVEVDRLAKSKYKGNTWAAWSEGTPKQKKMVSAILRFPGHIIVTMRSKTEWLINDGKPQRIGLAPEAGKGIEYEFDMLMELSLDHIGFISKDRTSRFQDKTIEKPGEDFGRELIEWLTT